MSTSVILRLDVPHSLHLLNILWQLGLIFARSLVLDGLPVHHDALSNGLAKREWLIVLLETSILSRVKHLLLPGTLR